MEVKATDKESTSFAAIGQGTIGTHYTAKQAAFEEARKTKVRGKLTHCGLCCAHKIL